jgi:hypothetical protein
MDVTFAIESGETSLISAADASASASSLATSPPAMPWRPSFWEATSWLARSAQRRCRRARPAPAKCNRPWTTLCSRRSQCDTCSQIAKALAEGLGRKRSAESIHWTARMEVARHPTPMGHPAGGPAQTGVGRAGQSPADVERRGVLSSLGACSDECHDVARTDPPLDGCLHLGRPRLERGALLTAGGRASQRRRVLNILNILNNRSHAREPRFSPPAQGSPHWGWLFARRRWL